MWIYQFVTAMVIIVIVEFVLYRIFILKGFDYSRRFSSDAAYEGQHISLVEVINNRSLLPVPWLQAEAHIEEGLEFSKAKDSQVSHGAYHRSIFSIMPFRRVTRKYDITCAKRGEYHLSQVTLTTGDVLGLVHKLREYPFDQKIFVYPKPLDSRGMQLPAHSWQGDTVVRRFIVDDPFMIAGVRDYQPGDSMSMICWKATAKTGELQVYKRDYTSNSRLLVIFNIDYRADQWSMPNERESACLEYAIRLCAYICNAMINKGIETGFVTNAHYRDEEEPVIINPAAGNMQKGELLKAMARIQLQRAVTMHTMLERLDQLDLKDTDILLVSKYTDDKMETALRRLRRRGNAVETLRYPDVTDNAGEKSAERNAG